MSEAQAVGPAVNEIAFAPADVVKEDLPGGGFILRSPHPLRSHERHLGEMLRRWAERRPDQVFLAERSADGWRRVTYAAALDAAGSIAESLLERGLGVARPVMILSGNSVDHALLSLGSLIAGVPVVPVSPAYSLMSRDYAKAQHIFKLVRPSLVFAEKGAPFSGVLRSLAGCGKSRVMDDSIASRKFLS